MIVIGEINRNIFIANTDDNGILLYLFNVIYKMIIDTYYACITTTQLIRSRAQNYIYFNNS